MSDTVDSSTLDLFERSLARCEARPGFLDLFYEKFMASSPEVAGRVTGRSPAPRRWSATPSSSGTGRSAGRSRKLSIPLDSHL